jgi:hypothetical protein
LAHPAFHLPASLKVGQWDGKVDRRRHKRIAVKLTCLVRSGREMEEIAKTENLSKGGLCVCLKMELSLGEFVTVICPYGGGAVELAYKAEVRYRGPHMVGQKRFYGLSYFKG